jgi:hypothetical protein
MIHRLAPGVVLLLVSCLAGDPPPSAAAPSSGAAAASGECGNFKIKTSSDLDSCKQKCKDTERDQMKACSGPGCQGGAATAGCVKACDDEAKSSQQAKCFK